MTEQATSLPLFPALASRLMQPLPLFPLRLAAQKVVDSLAARHPGLFARLGDQASKTFLLDPTDLPFAFILRPRPDKPAIDVVKRGEAVAWEAHIAGPFAALLGMLHGTMDGDALFFSRDIIIEGDTEAVLALRNAVDDAEIDLAAEIAAITGPASPYVAQVLRAIRPAAERLTGVALGRPGEAA